MILKSPYKKGDIVTLYKDPQKSKDLLGTARLREYRGTGLPFILSESSNEVIQETFVEESWLVDWITKNEINHKKYPCMYQLYRPRKLMVLYKTGI